MMYSSFRYLCRVLALMMAFLLLFALTACLGQPPVEEVTVVAENRLFGDMLYTSYSDGTAVLTGYRGEATELRLPDSVDGLTLVGIADQAFIGCETLTTLMTGETLSRIGNEAFYGCSRLETVEIGSNVTEVGYYAFEETPWMEAMETDFVVVGDGVLIKYRGSDSMVTVPSGVKVISDAFFQNETIRSVTFSADVVRIGDYAFTYCSNLREINFNEGLLEIGEYAFAFCEDLRLVTFPDSLLTLGNHAFFYCSMLRRAEGGKSLQTIGANAFNCCSHLTSLYLDSAVQTIGDGAFYDCYLLGGVTYTASADAWTQIQFGIGNECLTDAALRCLGK